MRATIGGHTMRRRVLTMQSRETTKRIMLDALVSILNIEGPAIFGAETGLTFKGLDVPYHFDKVRRAIREATREGMEIL